MLVSTLLVLLVCQFVISLKVPPSFSLSHTAITITNPQVLDIFHIIKKFELDSHLDVILIGSCFSESTVLNLASALDHLTRMSVVGSSMLNLHEKFIFHIFLGRVLEIPIESIIANKTLVDSSLIEQVLSSYYSKSSTSKSTTLFIINIELPIQYTYSYTDTAFNCSQRSFLSSEGFGWIDLAVQANDLWPSISGSNILPTIDLSDFSDTKDVEVLAYLIYRSAEALIPFPYTNYQRRGHQVQMKTNTLEALLPAKRTHLIVITICSDTTGKPCIPDTTAVAVTEDIIKLHSNSYTHITYSTTVFSLDEQVQLAHALHASAMFTPSGTGQRTFVRLNSKELLYWLWKSSVFCEAVTKVASGLSPDDKIVPLIAVHFPKTGSVEFDGLPNVHAAKVPLSSCSIDNGGSSLSGSVGDRASEFPVSAHSAVLSLRSGSDSKISTGLTCGTLSYTQADLSPKTTQAAEALLSQQTYFALLEAMWGLSAPHQYYSSTAATVVTDFLWAAPHRAMLHTSYSFREQRTVSRLLIISRAHSLLSRFSNSIQEASSMVPSMPISDFLSLDNELPNGPAAASARTRMKTADATGSRPSPSAPTSRGRGFGRYISSWNIVEENSAVERVDILGKFLVEMDLCARDMSHLDYESANSHLEAAEKQVHVLEGRLEVAAATRTGSIFCDSNADTMEDWDKKIDEGLSDSNIHALLFVFLAMIVGGLAGVVYSYPFTLSSKPFLRNIFR